MLYFCTFAFAAVFPFLLVNGQSADISKTVPPSTRPSTTVRQSTVTPTQGTQSNSSSTTETYQEGITAFDVFLYTLPIIIILILLLLIFCCRCLIIIRKKKQSEVLTDPDEPVTPDVPPPKKNSIKPEETESERDRGLGSAWTEYIKYNAAMKAYRLSGNPEDRPDLDQISSDPPEKIDISALQF